MLLSSLTPKDFLSFYPAVEKKKQKEERVKMETLETQP